MMGLNAPDVVITYGIVTTTVTKSWLELFGGDPAAIRPLLYHQTPTADNAGMVWPGRADVHPLRGNGAHTWVLVVGFNTGPHVARGDRVKPLCKFCNHVVTHDGSVWAINPGDHGRD